MILAQRMALTAQAVAHCTPSQLCLHPVLGPWLAFRCAMVFPVEGLDEETQAELIAKQPALCSHDDALHEKLTDQMREAFAQSTDNGRQIGPDAWRAWVLPRITAAPDHPHMYSSEQILYHYTKDLTFLARVAQAQETGYCTDCLRTPPSEKVVAFRQLLQRVLREYRDKFPDAMGAIFLSGGLDTSILAEASDQALQPNDCDPRYALSMVKTSGARPLLRFDHAITVQAHADALDAVYAQNIYESLKGISLGELHIVKRTLDDLLSNAGQVAKLLCTCDPMELRNSVVIYEALAEASARGAKQVMTGDGADEVFCGYSFYHKMDEEALMAYRVQIMKVMQFTATKLANAFGIEVFSPYLDNRVLEFALSLTKADLIGEQTPVPRGGPDGIHGKLILRQAFPESFSQWRSKQPIEQGAGTTALRLGYFDDRWTDEEFRAQQKHILGSHGVYVRDREHLFFFRAFIDAFDGDIANVPRRRSDKWRLMTLDEDEGFCPACHFELSHQDQDFCVTCGFWPTKTTATNNTNGYATQALEQLAKKLNELAK